MVNALLVSKNQLGTFHTVSRLRSFDVYFHLMGCQQQKFTDRRTKIFHKYPSNFLDFVVFARADLKTTFYLVYKNHTSSLLIAFPTSGFSKKL